jgi:hypothetical protein
MTNNHIELCGVQTLIKRKVYELNMAFREGTMADVIDLLGQIETEAREARYLAEKINER